MYMVSGWKYVHCQWMEICTWSVDGNMYMVSGWKYVHGQWMEICTWSVDEIMYMVSGRKYVNFASPMIMLYFNTSLHLVYASS